MFEERNSLMCFLREGCWEGPTDRNILRPSDEEKQATRGIDNWKAMIPKNQK